jgi:hypothetical protein
MIEVQPLTSFFHLWSTFIRGKGIECALAGHKYIYHCLREVFENKLGWKAETKALGDETTRNKLCYLCY